MWDTGAIPRRRLESGCQPGDAGNIYGDQDGKVPVGKAGLRSEGHLSAMARQVMRAPRPWRAG